jgi:hypothetical protein
MCVRLQTFGTCARKALKAARMLKLGAYSDDGEEEPDHDTGSECGECKHVTSEKARTSVKTRSYPSGSAGWRRVGETCGTGCSKPRPGSRAEAGNSARSSSPWICAGSGGHSRPRPCARQLAYCDNPRSASSDSRSRLGPAKCPSGGSALISTSAVPGKSLLATPGDPITTILRMRPW